MQPLALATATLLAAGQLVVYSCSSHDGELILPLEDVAVEIQGASGTPFDAFFEDDENAQRLTGTVPFTADFLDQVGFFEAIVDKGSGGSERLCVKVVTPRQSKESCTVDPFGRVSAAVVFD